MSDISKTTERYYFHNLIKFEMSDEYDSGIVKFKHQSKFLWFNVGKEETYYSHDFELEMSKKFNLSIPDEILRGLKKVGDKFYEWAYVHFVFGKGITLSIKFKTSEEYQEFIKDYKLWGTDIKGLQASYKNGEKVYTFF